MFDHKKCLAQLLTSLWHRPQLYRFILLRFNQIRLSEVHKRDTTLTIFRVYTSVHVFYLEPASCRQFQCYFHIQNVTTALPKLPKT